MALQVWLPLNGTLENKGLSNVTVTNNGATVDNNGKIGKCYNFNSNIINSGALNLSTYASNCSMAIWVKLSNSHSAWAQTFILGTSGTSWNNIRVGIDFDSSGTPYFNVSNGSANKNVAASSSIKDNNWHHVCGTFDGTNLKIYVDGILSNSTTTNIVPALSSVYIYIGGNAGGEKLVRDSKLNDARIYDHALSPKEVKEISKGLILHYKLDGNDIGITIPRNGDLIPDGVELYDYILSSGTLWIDTEFIPDDTSGIKLEAYCTTSGNNYQVMGCRQNGGNTRWWINFSSTLELSWNTWEGTINNYTNRWVLIEHNYLNSRVGKIDGVEKRTNYPTLANISYPAYLFTSCIYGSVGDCFYGRIKYVQITKGSKIVRNFLPCTYLGEPGMWDTVENKFYRNQGTGLFTLGNKITLKEYEYLLNDGNSYINTEYNLNTGDVFKFTYLDVFNNGTKVTGSSENKGYGQGTTGSSAANYSGGGRIYSGTIRMFLNSNNTDTGIASNNSTGIYTETLDIKASVIDIRFESSTGTVYINKTINSATKNTGVMHLYRDSGTLFVYPGVKKIYKVTITKNNQLVRDFIPVSYNGTPGLWDKVEWKFYANAGSGSFTLGPEKTVQQDAPIFYDSSGYCNHGSITGTLTTNSDSPRYTKSTVFNGSSGINAGHTAKVTDAITISYWAKTSTEGVAVSCTQNGGFSSISNGTFYMYANGTYGTIPNGGAWNNNAWHHIVNTFDGRYKKIYKDGTLAATLDLGAKYAIQYAALAPIWIGAESLNSNTPTTPYFNGSISDVRIYATALSEDDVKELYNTSAFVTNNGVFAEYELYEDNLSDVKKRGLLETANFYENGAESGYALDTDKTRVASNYIISEEFIEI